MAMNQSQDEADYSTLAGWVRSAQKGDERAMAQLLEASQLRLYRFLLMLVGDAPVAEDILQECFVRVLERIGSLGSPEAFVSWLFSMARNLYRDWLKSPKNAAWVSEEAIDRASSAPPPPAVEAVIEIHEALACLSPDERAVLLLVDHEGYSYAEAAKILKIPENTVRSRLHRARSVFGENFKGK
jgi:RNA polymerase sigma-70 factor (ECF subfamily)